MLLRLVREREVYSPIYRLNKLAAATGKRPVAVKSRIVLGNRRESKKQTQHVCPGYNEPAMKKEQVRDETQTETKR